MCNFREVNDDILREWLNIREQEVFCTLTPEDKKHYILMDVREEERYKEGHLENAISCPYGILKECYEQMDGKKIIVYCDFGGQSMMAARHLRKDGFEVYNIIGGVYYYMKEKEQNKSEA